MENSTSTKTAAGSSTSETIQLPDPVPYPTIHNLNEVKELRGKLCYVIKKYPFTGLGLTILRVSNADTVCIRISDFTGALLDPTDEVRYKPVMDYSRNLVLTMKLIGVPQALFYFSEIGKSFRLVDMLLSLNKFASPGYLADFFGKQKIPVQESIGDPITLTDDKIGELIEKKEEYILKPSAFKFMIRNDVVLPQYGIVNHETKLPT